MNPVEKKSGRRLLSKVVSLEMLAPDIQDHFRLRLSVPDITNEIKPGQFFHILPPGDHDLLRRPISVMDVDPGSGTVELLFRVIGDGTRLISKAGTGEELDIIAPLGNGYPLFPGRKAVLIGGGVGIPPLVFLARVLLNEGTDVDVLLGARDSWTLICVDNFEKLGINPDITTEDGSVGTSGFVTAIMQNSGDNSNPVVYSCGPIPMLKAVKAKAIELGWSDIYVSLENKLGCGVGACLGCSIPVYDNNSEIQYERVCTEGPVFPAERVAFDHISQ